MGLEAMIPSSRVRSLESSSDNVTGMILPFMWFPPCP